MIDLANAYNIQVMTTLELMKLMIDTDHIDMSKVKSIVQYWNYINDMPNTKAVFRKNYRKLFNENPP